MSRFLLTASCLLCFVSPLAAAVADPSAAPPTPAIETTIQQNIPWHSSQHPGMPGHGHGHGHAQSAPPHPMPLLLACTPKNVMAYWEELDLSSAQLAQLKELNDRANKETRRLVQRLGEIEQQLNKLLDDENADPQRLQELVRSGGQAATDLRLQQLAINQATRALLTPEQRAGFRTLQRPGN